MERAGMVQLWCSHEVYYIGLGRAQHCISDSPRGHGGGTVVETLCGQEAQRYLSRAFNQGFQFPLAGDFLDVFRDYHSSKPLGETSPRHLLTRRL